MTLKYPVFVIAKDDRYLTKFDTWDILKNWYEQIDIEASLYEGWDIEGVHFNLVWDLQLETMIEVFDEPAHLELLRNIILNFAREYRPDVPFNYTGGSILELYNLAKKHIN